MRIESIRWRNFTSWGNSWNEMTFSGESSLHLICGENGAGKSSISNLVVYMLYGKLDDFTQKEIANRVNRNFEGYIRLTGNGKSVVIHRGLNPSKFDVEVDGNVIDTAGKANVQAYLEDEVYGVPYTLFRNSIILSVDDFKSFIKLTPNEKRTIVDRLFGYSAINEVSAKVKGIVKELKVGIGELESKIDGYNDSIETIREKIASLEEESESDARLEKEREEKGLMLEKYVEAEGKITVQLDKLESRVGALRSEENEVRRRQIECGSDVNSVRKQLELYKNKKCPLCGADLTDDTHEGMRRELEKAYNDAISRKEEADEAMADISERLSALDGKCSVGRGKLNEARSRIARLREELSSVNDGRKGKIEELNSLVGEIESKIEPAEKEMAKLEKKCKLYGIIGGIFSENGLKQYISNIYVPVINKYVEEVRERLGVYHRIVFDTNYDCKLYYLGEEVGYKTLSKGERKKADIAVTLAFLKIMKTKVSDINLLFLDEVLSGIDVGSCNELLTIFREYSRDMNLNIYIVHHANLESANVDSVIEIVKKNGFSRFASSLKEESDDGIDGLGDI